MAADRKLRPCAMPSCHGERFDLVHKFPMDNERAKNWLRWINLPELNRLPLDQLRKKYFICSKHFRKIDYKNCESRSLNQTAYPRLFLSEDATEGNESADANPQNMDVSSTSMDDRFLLPQNEDRAVFVLNSTISSPVEILGVDQESEPQLEFSPSKEVTMTMSISPSTSASLKPVKRPIIAKRIQTISLNEHLLAKRTKSSVFTIQSQVKKEKQNGE